MTEQQMKEMLGFTHEDVKASLNNAEPEGNPWVHVIYMAKHWGLTPAAAIEALEMYRAHICATKMLAALEAEQKSVSKNQSPSNNLN